MFTFVVTCYNQAEVVRDALESIKFQIENFGKGQKFQMIVTDDGSKDESRKVIRQWISDNEGLFAKTDKLFRKENAGICKNYVKALKLVEGERFLVLNGDDLLAPYNVFEITDLLDKYDIVCTAFMKFKGSGEMIRSYGTYLEVVLQNFIKGKTLKRAVKLGCPVMGTAVYRKELLTEEVFQFILHFKTVNDRACFQKIISSNENIRVCYVNRPFILYRITENSISNFNSPTRILHNKEIAKLCRAERKAEKLGFFRAMLFLQEKSAAVRANSNYFVRLLRFLSPYYFIMLWLYLTNHEKIVRMEHQLVDRHWKECSALQKALQKNYEKY
ncbi:MAG: glycosyltransferase family 2 protein [Dorea sp.]|nr:glycosyltransferase family 2 protein [Dorea sp.]